VPLPPLLALRQPGCSAGLTLGVSGRWYCSGRVRESPESLARVALWGSSAGRRLAHLWKSPWRGPRWRARSGMSGAGAPDIPDISDMSRSAGRLTLVPVTLAKGLEFDHVVLVEPANIATGETYGLRRLYVALTRAVSRLTVFHAEPLPAELSLHTIRGAFEVGPRRGRRPPRAFRSGGRGLSLERRLRDQHRGGILRRFGRARFWQNYDQ
jgi:hypothetical protein